jgi:hypothetical protein
MNINDLPERVPHSEMKIIGSELELAGYFVVGYEHPPMKQKCLYIGTIQDGIDNVKASPGHKLLVVQALYAKSADENGVLWVKEEPIFTYMEIPEHELSGR